MKIKVETIINSDIDQVWKAWNTPEDINRWNAASDDWHNPESRLDLKPGGTFSYRMEARDGSMGFDFEGTYSKVIEKNLIEYYMADGREVSVQFIQLEGGVMVVEEFDAETENDPELQRQGWQSILDNFKKHVELKLGQNKK